jgi:hypothetical protein
MQSPTKASSWRLEDAALIAKANPYTFYKPSPQAIALLRRGNLVKLIFAFDSDDPKAPAAERMWVDIDQIDGDRFSGTLDNEPLHIRDLTPGCRIDFEGRHIIQTDIDDPVPDPTRPYWARCFVTNRVLKDGRPVGYFYREMPDEDNDSGWRILAGDESDDYTNTPTNCAYVSLGAVLSEDDSILELLDTPAPCAFARNPETGLFEAVDPPQE